MLLNVLSGGNIRDALIQILLMLPIVMFALSFHETAHGYIAHLCGDDTAYRLGRLTLNPAKHLDPLGFLCMLLVGFGWAKPVPVNARNFKNPKVGMALTGIAGPASNFLLGLLNALLCGLSFVLYLRFYENGSFVNTFLALCYQFFWLATIINFLFMAFNLVPFPPFDGSRFVYVFLPTRVYFSIMRYERQIMLGLLVFFFLLSRLGYSPFSWAAYGLTDFFSDLSVKLFAKILP